ncbi:MULTISPECIES: hypothetical protein [Streptomyces]|uniref:SH3 domain-containing protein n=2 Tax=Streptomyces cacaoi TaxID=1898 RepID=A0A4Y3R635_STRCI|nr:MULTISPECIES: hypothetical protein [Streptomyces]NNG87644.1 SH3 domain-containing protein [Streptomyces cacaoi]QHF98057.1 hypothetical protein DEH18_34235 [Streptomyces sp. NHF165]GEB53176.1 hypothetical protein SCA03_57270 [Streptomyces cacaoi]
MRTKLRIAATALAVAGFAGAAVTGASGASAVTGAPAAAVAKTTNVKAYDTAGVLRHPNFSDKRMLSEVRPGYTYPALCWTEGATVTDNGVTNNVWIKIALNKGGAGYVPAVYFKGDKHAGVPNHC